MEKLKLSDLRRIEEDFNCFLGNTPTPLRCGNQQFGIFDGKDQLLASICASKEFFTEEELREKLANAHKEFLRQQ